MIKSISNKASLFIDKNEEFKLKTLDFAEKELKNDGVFGQSFKKIMNRVDNFLNLSSTKSFDFSSFNKEEMKSFLKIMSKLMKKGVVGYDYYEVNGKIEKHFITTSIGNKRLYNSEKIYKISDSRRGWLV